LELQQIWEQDVLEDLSGKERTQSFTAIVTLNTSSRSLLWMEFRAEPTVMWCPS